MITYNWQIIAKHTVPQSNDYTDVVVAVIWKLEAENENGHKSDIVFTSFFQTLEDNFIPYNDLTDEIVIGWIENKEDIDSLKAELESNLNY